MTKPEKKPITSNELADGKFLIESSIKLFWGVKVVFSSNKFWGNQLCFITKLMKTIVFELLHPRWWRSFWQTKWIVGAYISNNITCGMSWKKTLMISGNLLCLILILSKMKTWRNKNFQIYWSWRYGLLNGIHI